MAPAATDSPIEPTVRAKFSSRIEPLKSAQHGHADDGRRIGGGDRHAGAQAEVGVGRAENDAHDEPEQERPQGELRHGRVRGDVRLELLVAHETSRSALVRGKKTQRQGDGAF